MLHHLVGKHDVRQVPAEKLQRLGAVGSLENLLEKARNAHLQHAAA